MGYVLQSIRIIVRDMYIVLLYADDNYISDKVNNLTALRLITLQP